MSEQLLNVISAVGLMLAAIIVLGVYNRHRIALTSLHNQLLITFMSVAGVSVAVAVVIVLVQIHTILVQREGERFSDLAQLNSQHLSQQLAANITRLQDESEKSSLGGTADTAATPLDNLSPNDRLVKIQKQEQEWIDRHFSPALQVAYLNVATLDLENFISSAPELAQVMLTDRYGRVVAIAGLEGNYYRYDNQSWWQKAWNNGQGDTYLGSPRLMPDGKSVVIDVAIPVSYSLEGSTADPFQPGSGVKSSQRLVGVLSALLRVDELINPNKTMLSNATYELLVVDNPTGLILYDTTKDRIGQKIPAYMQGYEGKVSTYQDDTGQNIIYGHALLQTSADLPLLKPLNWTVIVQQPETKVIEMGRFFLPVLVSGLLVILFAALGSVGISWQLTRPIKSLTIVAEAVSSGQFDQPAPVSGPSEFRTLAESFNSMSNRLRQMLANLEQQVATRTKRLEIVATLGERLSAILNLEELLTEVVNQIQARFGYYHAHIYLFDDDHKNLVVAAGTGPAGAEMKAKRHHIPLETMTSLVARAARSGTIVRVDNVREAEDWLPNPLLPDTYSEMAVPIILEEKVVGVLDVQENKLASFDESDAALLRSLANQVAVAMRNARQFEKVETSLAEAHETQRRYMEQAWDKSQAMRHGVGRVQFSLGESRTLSETALQEARRQAIAHKSPAVVTVNGGVTPESSQPITGNDKSKQYALVAPITLGETTIGNLQLHGVDPMRQWNESDLALISAVIDQIAQTSENLRLLNETQERASREQFISQVSDKLRRAPDMQALMKVATEEIAHVLNPARTFIRFDVKTEVVQGHGGNGAASPHPPLQLEAETDALNQDES